MYQTTITPLTRYDELREQFLKYHREHPEVYVMFKRFTFELINSGRKNGSTAMIIERIRWESSINPNADITKEFKIANDHKPFYARLFMHHFPEHDGFFRLKYMFSKDHPATGIVMTPDKVREELY